MELEKLQDANIKIYEAQAEPVTHATCKPSLTKCLLGCPRAILFGYVQHVRMFRYDVSRHYISSLGWIEYIESLHRSKQGKRLEGDAADVWLHSNSFGKGTSSGKVPNKRYFH